METEANNARFLERVAAFLNGCPSAIDAALVRETARDCGVDAHAAYLLLLAGAMDLYADRELYERYLKASVIGLDPSAYENDPYRKAIRFPAAADGAWTLKTEAYAPYELFVCGDMARTFDGRVLPRLGYFAAPFSYPCVLQNGRLWMSVTPNEIETMKRPIERARGDVCAYGLGMGYFAFMASEKREVGRVTVVERDASAIRLFRQHLLPQFPQRDKILLVHSDALDYAEERHAHDFVFADLWHDVSDGLPLWRALRRSEREGTEYAYWIEDTMRLYDA